MEPSTTELGEEKQPRRSVLEVESFGATDRGRVREHNEDQFLIAELGHMMRVHQSSLSQPSALLSAERGWLLVVADGMGGHKGGEQASALALLSIEHFFLNTLQWFFRLRGEGVLAEFQNALRFADERIFQEAARRPELEGMGTTLTMAYAVDDSLYVVHAGDSRLYLLRGGQLRQVTEDHTLVGQMVRAGELSPAEAANYPYKHIVTSALGGSEPGLKVDTQKIALAEDDVVLICSDGLHGMIAEDQITDALHGHPDPEDACNELTARANQAGGRDNITTIVARFR
jgi:protein phosphatase